MWPKKRPHKDTEVFAHVCGYQSVLLLLICDLDNISYIF